MKTIILIFAMALVSILNTQTTQVKDIVATYKSSEVMAMGDESIISFTLENGKSITFDAVVDSTFLSSLFWNNEAVFNDNGGEIHTVVQNVGKKYKITYRVEKVESDYGTLLINYISKAIPIDSINTSKGK